MKPNDTDKLIQKINDICENAYIKEQLKEKEEELQRYLDAVDKVALIYKMDKEGKITFANNKLLETSLYSLHEIIQINFLNLIHYDIPRD